MNLLSIAATILLIGPIPIETGKFTIIQDGKKIGSEQFSISNRTGGGYIVESKTQLSGDPSTLTSKLEVDAELNPVSYEYSHGKGQIHVNVDPPISQYESINNGAKSSMEFRFPEHGMILDNNFFAHFVLLLYKSGEAEGTIPIFVPQDFRAGAATVKQEKENVFTLEIGDIRMEATTDKTGKLIRLTVPESKVVIER